MPGSHNKTKDREFVMKKIIAAAIMSLASFATFAQSATTATTTATTNSTSGATNQGVNTNLTFNSPPEVKYSGSYTVKEAPPVEMASGYGSFSQQNCMVSGSAGVSVVGIGATGQAPIDGKHCDWRLDQAALAQSAMTIHNFVAANPTLPDDAKKRMELKAAAMLRAAGDMSCLSSDRERDVLMKEGLCGAVDDISSVDHREGQPQAYAIDYGQVDGGKAQVAAR
jgi:hypothetical protein